MSRNRKRNRKNATVQPSVQNNPPVGQGTSTPLPPSPPPLPTTVAQANGNDLSVPIIVSALIIAGIVLACVFMFARGPQDDAQKGQSDASAKFSSSSQVIKDGEKGQGNKSTPGSSQVKPSTIGDMSSFSIDLNAPEHSEGIAVYHSTFKTSTNEALESLKGLEVYEDIYTFSVGVNSYTTKIKELVQDMGVFLDLKEATDNASYIVTQGTAKDGALVYQLFNGTDGSQEVSVSYVIGATEMKDNADEVWSEMSTYLKDYIGADIAANDLKELAEHVSNRADDGGSFTLIVSDDESKINIQISVAQTGAENEQWNCVGVRLVQDSQVTIDTSTQAPADNSGDTSTDNN